MDFINVYCIKTDIVKEDKTKLQINVLGNNLADVTNSADYLKYNGKSISDHIISVEKVVDKVYQYTYNKPDLNPNYNKSEEDIEDE